jgi:hypothetical protein
MGVFLDQALNGSATESLFGYFWLLPTALPLKRQCEILDLSRSGIYYTPAPVSDRDMALRNCHQHGRQGSMDRQRLYRTVMEERQIRGYLSEGLQFHDIIEKWVGHLLHILQRKTVAQSF